MKCLAWLALVLAGIACQSRAGEPPAERILQAFRERDLIALQAVVSGDIERLGPGDRNRVALAASQALALEPYHEAIGTNALHRYFTKPPSEDTPAETECRRQWGINMAAAEILRSLAEKRLITDPRVLPGLIGGLDHRDRTWVGQKCFYALKSLTRRTTGEAYWGRLAPDGATHAETVRWWQEWWRAQAGKHPVFDAALEATARDEVLRLARLIGANVKPVFPEMRLFEVPTALPLRWQIPLFLVEYDPANWSLPADAFGRSGSEDLPWILIACRFQREGLKDAWTAEEGHRPRAELRDRVTTCYSRVIPDSDLRVEVKAASRNEALVAAIRAALDRPAGGR